MKNENVPNTFLLNASLRRLNDDSSKVCHCALQAGNLQQTLSLYMEQTIILSEHQTKRKILAENLLFSQVSSTSPPQNIVVCSQTWTGDKFRCFMTLKYIEH